MSALRWAEVFPGTGCFEATGDEAVYLLAAADPRQVMLSRYVPGRQPPAEIQATLDIIVVPLVLGMPQAAMSDLKALAQRYEDGEDIEGYRAWDRRAA